MCCTETVLWTSDEIELYQQAMIKFDKDFFRVSQQVTTCTHHRKTRICDRFIKLCIISSLPHNHMIVLYVYNFA